MRTIARIVEIVFLRSMMDDLSAEWKIEVKKEIKGESGSLRGAETSMWYTAASVCRIQVDEP